MAAHPNHHPSARRPGQKAVASGIYPVLHLDHRRQHDVIIIRGEEFPGCYGCGDEVRFYLVREIGHITNDFDLAGPRPQLLRTPLRRPRL